jgi:hypothetical protein
MLPLQYPKPNYQKKKTIFVIHHPLQNKKQNKQTQKNKNNISVHIKFAQFLITNI